MQSTMMSFPLTLAHILERAGRVFADSEVVSRLPDRTLHRYRYLGSASPSCTAGA